MSRSVRRRLLLGVGLAVVVALVAGGAVAMVSTRERDERTVTAIFKDASPLVAGNYVKMDGVQVGTVSSIALKNGHAEVRMKLDMPVPPLHRDARATIRPLSILGERYVDLAKGSDHAPTMSETETIGEGQTESSVDIQDVLNSLDDPTSTALASVVTTLGEGTNGQGRQIADTLKALAPTMRDTGRLGQVLDQQNDVLGQLVDSAQPVADALAGDHGAELDRLVGSARSVLDAVNAKRSAMDSTLRELPGTLRQAQRTLAELGGASDAATPALRSIRPVTDNLSDITAELNAFADTADPALASLPQVLQRGEALLDQAAPVVRDLRPGGDALRGVSGSANRIVGDVSKNFTTVLDFVKFWALCTNGKDGVSNYFRGQVVDTPQALLQVPGLALGDGPKAPPTPHNEPGPPEPIGGKLPEPVGPTQPEVPSDASTPTEAPAPADNGNSATGLSSHQEQSLVQQLLGGR